MTFYDKTPNIAVCHAILLLQPTSLVSLPFLVTVCELLDHYCGTIASAWPISKPSCDELGLNAFAEFYDQQLHYSLLGARSGFI